MLINLIRLYSFVGLILFDRHGWLVGFSRICCMEADRLFRLNRFSNVVGLNRLDWLRAFDRFFVFVWLCFLDWFGSRDNLFGLFNLGRLLFRFSRLGWFFLFGRLDLRVCLYWLSRLYRLFWFCRFYRFSRLGRLFSLSRLENLRKLSRFALYKAE